MDSPIKERQMSFMKKLYSRNFFILNLVLVGVIAGFALAYTGFSRSARAQAALGPVSIRAESPADLAPPEVKAAIAQAESVQNAFRYVADKVKPSVVEINVVETKEQSPKAQDQLPWRFFFGPQDQAPEQDPQPYEERGTGSGVIVRRDGKSVYVLTNNHVAGNATKITVILNDEREFQGELVGKDDRKDLAMVKFETDSPDIAVASLGDSSALRVGDWAIAIGSPFGLVSSVTAGIVSALGRAGGPDGNNISDFIQTDAAINKGNSGGALVNIRGEVVGINTWIASPTGGSIGLGFAVPINNAKKTIDDLITKRKVEYGWLGIQMREPDKAASLELGAELKRGVVVTGLFMGSPAQKGGFLVGDLVLRADGELVKTQDQLARVVGDIPAGDSAAFQVLRDGKKLDLEVRIEARTEGSANDSNLFPGMDVLSLKSESVQESKLPKGASGVLVANVQNKTPAATIQVKVGDIITEVNDKPISSLRDFYRAINDPKAKEMVFTLIRDGSTIKSLAYVKK
ncbi:MAG TPA: Do family serine endopeptidase [Spirochaetia bacterium]|nr:Do family serine endopeptidase [Spirochaetia bacterium]HRZ65509.1 Do family serine endopeptidase [Spirochaetia bacterium]